MATKFKFEIESDGLTTAQTLAFRTFIGTLGGAEFLEQLRQEELKEYPAQQDESAETPEPEGGSHPAARCTGGCPARSAAAAGAPGVELRVSLFRGIKMWYTIL